VRVQAACLRRERRQRAEKKMRFMQRDTHAPMSYANATPLTPVPRHRPIIRQSPACL